VLLGTDQGGTPPDMGISPVFAPDRTRKEANVLARKASVCCCARRQD
jgi:hypothetical protein